MFIIFSSSLYAETPDTLLANTYLEEAIELIDALNFEEALQLTDKALIIYQSITDTLPQFGLAYSIKGDALFEKGDYDDALECYEKGLELSEELGNKLLLSILIGSLLG